MAKLMDVLETTEANRRVDTSTIDHELLRQKDREIARLTQEVASLRTSSGVASTSNSKEDNKNKQESVRSMVYSVKNNRQKRKSNVSHMQALTVELEACIASGDQLQMQKLVESLKSAIQTGEKSSSRMDREMVNMIDFSAAHLNPASFNADANLDELVVENQKLRRKLEKKHHCKKCGYKRSDKKDEKSQASTVLEENA